MTTIKTYWDHTEAERAAMSEAEVERFVDFELMSQGVLRAPRLELVEETGPELRLRTLYQLKIGYTKLDIAFDSAEDAERFISESNAYSIQSEYLNGRTVPFYSAIEDGADGIAIEPVRIARQDDVKAARAQLEKQSAAKSENEKRRQAHEKATKAERDALQGLWSDWHRCRELDARMRRTVETFEDYQRIASGDENVAGRFLLKVFSREQIAEAAQWCGVVIPVPEELLGREVAQRVPAEPVADDFPAGF